MRNNIFNILKFIIFVVIIPVIVATVVSFSRQLHFLPGKHMAVFNWGIVVFLIIHLLVAEWRGAYRYGQKMVSDIFRFFSPLVNVAPYLLPIYSILALIALYFLHFFRNSPPWLDRALLFAVSFTFTMHLVFTARDLREKDNNVVKPNYFFSLALIYLINIFILALLLDLVSEKFSFLDFFNEVSQITGQTYRAMWRQLFG